MPTKSKVTSKTVSQLKKECQHYLQSAFREIQYQCQENLTKIQDKMSKNTNAAKKAHVKLKETTKKFAVAKKAHTKKATKSLQKRIKSYSKQVKELTSTKAQLEKELVKLKIQLSAIKIFKKKEKAREQAVKVFEKTYKDVVPTVVKKKKEKISSSKALIGHALGVGDVAPLFSTLIDHDSKINLSLKDLRGKSVVLYFYPKDDTPGCTHESIEFSDSLDKFTDANTAVFGISRDSIASHCKFKAKHNLAHTLISDADENICQAYGVIKNKNMYGKQVRGIERSTFLVDKNGMIKRIWRGVKVLGHADEVLAAAM